MKMTHMAAIKLYRQGQRLESYAVALQDEGLNRPITQKEWETFAKKCIARTDAQERANASFVID